MSDCTYGGGNNPACSTPTTVVVVPSTGISPVHNSDLPFTGGDVIGLTMFGIGMLTAGIALVRSGRRKAAGAGV